MTYGYHLCISIFISCISKINVLKMKSVVLEFPFIWGLTLPPWPILQPWAHITATHFVIHLGAYDHIYIYIL